jgi:dTDP-4-dehydrorhamnose 3,5-epimerase-like enzyme
MIKKIKVKNSGLIKLNTINDFPDGNLIIGEVLKSVPFKIRRFYLINNLLNKKSIRGKHAHKKLEQVIFCINGSFTLALDDGENKQKILMNDPTIGVKLGKLLWVTMSHFSKDCAILVIANNYYKENDYIRNYNNFIKYLKEVRL